MTQPIFDLDTTRSRHSNQRIIVRAIIDNAETWKSIRKASGLSQQAVARKICCSQGTITGLECTGRLRRYRPSPDLAIDYLVCVANQISDDKLSTYLCDEDIRILRWIQSHGDTPRMEEIRYEREHVNGVNRAKLKVVLEGEIDSQEFGQTCKWPDCGWTWYPDGLSDPHSGTCPLAD